MMKVVHEKFKITGSKKNADPCIAEFKLSFNNAVEKNKELGSLVDKTQQLLNPTKVLQLFQNIRDDVGILCRANVHYNDLSCPHYYSLGASSSSIF